MRMERWMEMRMEVMKVMRMEMWQLTAAALYWELQVVSFPGNGRTVGGGKAGLPKLNWGLRGGRGGGKRLTGKHGQFLVKRVLRGSDQKGRRHQPRHWERD